VAPVGLLLLSAAVFLVRRRWDRPDAGNVFVYMSLSMLMATYFDVTIKALSGISCTLSDGYMNMFPWVSCDSGDADFRTIAGLSGTCLLVYTIGIPLLLAVALFRRRHHRDDPDVQRQLGFLFGGYRKGAYYWEFVAIVRRLVLALALTLVPFTVGQVAVVVIVVVLVSSIAVQHGMSPFTTVLENRLELFSLYSLLFSFLGVYVAENSVGTDAPLLWLPFAVVVLVVLTSTILLSTVAVVLLIRYLPSLRRIFGVHFGARNSLLERVVTLATTPTEERSPLLKTDQSELQTF
jgi:hypothetical protein